MACGSCGGSGCPTCLSVGCSPCNVSSPCQVPVVTGCRCGSSPCSCGSSSGCCQGALPATPSPYYACTPTCQENNCQIITNNYFAAAICVSYAFNIPACDENASVYFPSVKVLPAGTYLWNLNYGYLEVLSFNPQTGQAIVTNHCDVNNAAPGTNVPACTCFLVTPVPLVLDTLSTLESALSEVASGNINTALSTITTTEIELVFANTSLTNILNVLVNIRADGSFTAAGATIISYGLQLNINGGGYSTVMARGITTFAGLQTEQIISTYTGTVAPSGSLSLKLKAFMQNVSGGANVNLASLQAFASGLGVSD